MLLMLVESITQTRMTLNKKLIMNLMAWYASWNDIKPMLRLVAAPVVVLLGGLWAVMAEEGIRLGQFAITDCITYSACGFNMIRIEGTKLFSCGFALFCFLIFFTSLALNKSAFGCFLKIALNCFTTIFATGLKSVFCASVKFRNRFDLLASATSLCYDGCGHFNLLNRLLCFKADCSTFCNRLIYYRLLCEIVQ